MVEKAGDLQPSEGWRGSEEEETQEPQPDAPTYMGEDGQGISLTWPLKWIWKDSKVSPGILWFE